MKLQCNTMEWLASLFSAYQTAHGRMRLVNQITPRIPGQTLVLVDGIWNTLVRFNIQNRPVTDLVCQARCKGTLVYIYKRKSLTVACHFFLVLGRRQA